MYFQTMNILIVNQSIIDLCSSFFTLLTAVAEVDGTRMSRNNAYDQFLCRIWITRSPLWNFLTTSTYNILLMTLERYAAVVYPVWYSSKVSKTYHMVDARVSILAEEEGGGGEEEVYLCFGTLSLFIQVC